MYLGTTPTITLRIKSDFDFGNIKEVWFTLASISNRITKTLENIVLNGEEKTISITLSQEETFMFAAGNVYVQVRILTNNGDAFATPIKTIKFEKILEEGVIGE